MAAGGGQEERLTQSQRVQRAHAQGGEEGEDDTADKGRGDRGEEAEGEEGHRELREKPPTLPNDPAPSNTPVRSEQRAVMRHWQDGSFAYGQTTQRAALRQPIPLYTIILVLLATHLGL